MFGLRTGAKGQACVAGVVGIQRSSQALTSYPECIFCLIPKSNSYLAAEILVHTYEALLTERERKGELIL